MVFGWLTDWLALTLNIVESRPWNALVYSSLVSKLSRLVTRSLTTTSPPTSNHLSPYYPDLGLAVSLRIDVRDINWCSNICSNNCPRCRETRRSTYKRYFRGHLIDNKYEHLKLLSCKHILSSCEFVSICYHYLINLIVRISR